jgi:chromosome segregation ATPase
LAKYIRYLFNQQHNTGRVTTEQRVSLNAYVGKDTLM